MLSRNETLYKWLHYGGCALVIFVLQGSLLQRVTVLGVMPFLYPTVVGILAMYEGSFAGSAYGLALGLLCDLLVPAPLPCFYTLVFPLVGLCCGLLSGGLLSAGFLCSLGCVMVAMFLTDLFHCLVLAASGAAAWRAGGWLFVRELAVTLPCSLPVFFLHRFVYRKYHIND